MAAEFLVGFDAFAGDAHGDALFEDPAPEMDLVVCLVAVVLGRLAAARSALIGSLAEARA